jgi:site-specific recombinase XerD
MSGKIRLGKTKDSRTRAKAKLEEVDAVLRLGKELQKQPEFTDYLLGRGYSASTIRHIIKNTYYFLKWAEKENVPIENTRYADILNFIQDKRDRVKQITISMRVNSLKHYFNFLVTAGVVVDNPTRGIRIRGIKRKIFYELLSKEELESLYHHFDLTKEVQTDKHKARVRLAEMAFKRDKVMLGFMIYQGLSVRELGALRESDIKLREGKVFIEGTRRSEARELTLESHQILDLMEYQLRIRPEIIEKWNKQSDKFFMSIGQSNYLNNTLQELMGKLHKQNSKVSSAKQIRSNVITNWLKLYNLRQVQYMAGHRYVSSTEDYLANIMDDLQEDITRFHPLS